MRSKLFPEKPERTQISTERWVLILPDTGEGYTLYDNLQERYLGRILIDTNDCWIYDGTLLSIDEQEELAAFITGNQGAMNRLISSL